MVKIFLHSVSQQLGQTQKIIEGIYELYDQLRLENRGIKSPFVIPLIDMMFEMPIFTLAMVQESTKCSSYITASTLIKRMIDAGHVENVGKVGREKLYEFRSLVKVLK